MNNETYSRNIGDLADAKETAQAVYDALHKTRFGSFCNSVFSLTQFTLEPQPYNMNGEDITGYEIKGRSIAAVVENIAMTLFSLLTSKKYQATWNYKLRFPVGGRVEVEILETMCKSKTCNRNYTNDTLEALGIDHFDLIMMDYAR
jgi:hypothetical protein